MSRTHPVDPLSSACLARPRSPSLDRWEDEGGSARPEPGLAKVMAPPPRRSTSTRRRETAEECRERAAADLLSSVSMLIANERRRMETSAASWTARAELLDRAEANFEARKIAGQTWSKRS